MSGYDVKKLVDAGLSHFWHENYGQIYPTLELLVKNKLATKEQDRVTSKRRRFVYTITDKGRQEFHDWLAEPAEAPIVRNELQLKYFLSCNLPAKQSARLIKEYRMQQQIMLDEYSRSEAILLRAIQEGIYPDELKQLLGITLKTPTAKNRKEQCEVFYMTLRHGIRVVEARLAWCDEVLDRLNV